MGQRSGGGTELKLYLVPGSEVPVRTDRRTFPGTEACDVQAFRRIVQVLGQFRAQEALAPFEKETSVSYSGTGREARATGSFLLNDLGRPGFRTDLRLHWLTREHHAGVGDEGSGRIHDAVVMGKKTSSLSVNQI